MEINKNRAIALIQFVNIELKTVTVYLIEVILSHKGL